MDKRGGVNMEILLVIIIIIGLRILREVMYDKKRKGRENEI